jgi:hypothetical protein
LGTVALRPGFHPRAPLLMEHLEVEACMLKVKPVFLQAKVITVTP